MLASKGGEPKREHVMRTHMHWPLHMRIWTPLLAAAILTGCGPQKTDTEGGSPAAPTPATAPAATPPSETSRQAVATIEARSGSTLEGTATFSENPDGSVAVEITLSGVTPGPHAVHLHENGDCSAEDGTSAGPHWNPAGVAHGGPHSDPHHAGDLGNIEIGEDGTGTLKLTTHDFNLDPASDHCAIGRGIIVHEKADDFVSQPSGAAGSRIGCGVVEAR